MEMNLEQFNPTVAELTKLAAESKQLTITDYADPAQVKAVHDQRIVLRDARVGITKKAKEFREDALAFQKKVIEKEKELIAIITPEEDRLDQMEQEAKAHAVKLERERKWPERLARLKELEYKGGSSDDHVLKMLNDVEFETYINNVKAKIEAEALAECEIDRNVGRRASREEGVEAALLERRPDERIRIPMDMQIDNQRIHDEGYREESAEQHE
jgi:hypothetical protein